MRVEGDGAVYKRCGCRDGHTGRQWGARCPRLGEPAHGRWYFATQITTPDGKRQRVRRGGFASRGRADHARQQLLALPDARAAGQVWTVARWLEYWLDEATDRLAPSTLRNYRTHVHRFLIPHLGHIRLGKLHTAQVQGMFRRLATRRAPGGRLVAAATLQHIRATLRSALNEAHRQGLVGHNAARRVRLPHGGRPHAVVWTPDREALWRATGLRPAVAVWTPEHLARFLTAVQDDDLFALWWLVALRGPRRGETVALRLSDFNFDTSEFTVREQITVVDDLDYLGPPKSPASYHTVAMDTVTAEILAAHHARQLQRLVNGANPGGYMFTRPDGTPINPDWLTRRFHKLVRTLGLPPVRLHDLRHGAASIALAAGADIKTIQQMLGHSSPITGLETYISVLPDLAHAAAEAAARLLLAAAGRRRLALLGASQA